MAELPKKDIETNTKCLSNEFEIAIEKQDNNLQLFQNMAQLKLERLNIGLDARNSKQRNYVENQMEAQDQLLSLTLHDFESKRENNRIRGREVTSKLTQLYGLDFMFTCEKKYTQKLAFS